MIATTCRKPVDAVRPESTFEELGVDSLDLLNVLFELEGEFDVQIDDVQAKSVTTVQGMIDGLKKLILAKDAPPEGTTAEVG